MLLEEVIVISLQEGILIIHSKCYIFEADLQELERQLEACQIDFE